ncbi:MAG TPA: hypothetical protein PK747_08755 [Acidobacteriota bacterium]|nr:hypothetical protein [Acidobacteriota bacterium]HNT16917.1 hypothetical protein [Acidobacteriota bacterium]HQO20703.1 hypothetical protein [Acidobacteriota bacterium]HQQ47484.1 hypothetical protein [Acidobacteriota bacterium]
MQVIRNECCVAEKNNFKDWSQLLATLNGQLASFRKQLLIDPRYIRVEYDLEFKKYNNTLIISIFVDACCNDDNSIVWWMDIMPEGSGWRMERRITRNGRDIVLEFADILINDDFELMNHWELLLKELLKDVHTIK